MERAGSREKFWRAGVFALFLALIFLYSFNRFKESDSFYHLRTGELIWETGSVPHADVFSFTAPGAPWVTHEWLAELIFYLMFRIGGYWGVMAFVALLSVATYYVLYRLVRAAGAQDIIALPLLVLVGYLAFELWVPRPQVFSFLWFVLLIHLLERYRRGRSRRNLIAAVVLMLLWADMGASFILGIAVIGLYAAVAAGEYVRARRGGAASKRSAYELAAACAAAALVSLLNPNGYKIFLYSATIQSSVAALNVLEWKPITVFLYETQAKIFLAMMVIVNAASVWWFWVRRESRDMLPPALLLSVSILPFIAIRHVGYVALIASVEGAVVASFLAAPYLKKLSPGACYGIVAVVFAVLLAQRALALPRSPINDSLVPVHAADFIQEQNIGGHCFNLYNDGGYFIWRFYPQRMVFIDGRSEVYGPQQIQDLYAIIRPGASWDALVTGKYHLNCFILAYQPGDPDDPMKPLASTLISRDWPLVYWDDASLIFVRPVPENLAVIQAYFLEHVNPFRDPTKIPREEVKAAIAELDRRLKQEPYSKAVQDYASRFLFSNPYARAAL